MTKFKLTLSNTYHVWPYICNGHDGRQWLSHLKKKVDKHMQLNI